jgi:hypothetical protein
VIDVPGRANNDRFHLEFVRRGYNTLV